MLHGESEARRPQKHNKQLKSFGATDDLKQPGRPVLTNKSHAGDMARRTAKCVTELRSATGTALARGRHTAEGRTEGPEGRQGRQEHSVRQDRLSGRCRENGPDAGSSVTRAPTAPGRRGLRTGEGPGRETCNHDGAERNREKSRVSARRRPFGKSTRRTVAQAGVGTAVSVHTVTREHVLSRHESRCATPPATCPSQVRPPRRGPGETEPLLPFCVNRGKALGPRPSPERPEHRRAPTLAPGSTRPAPLCPAAPRQHAAASEQVVLT